MFIKLPGVKRERVRCQTCAGEAPPELPPLEARPKPQPTTKRLKPIAQIAREWLPYREAE